MRPPQYPNDQVAEDAAGLSGSRAGQGGVASALSKLSVSDREKLLELSKSGAQWDEVRRLVMPDHFAPAHGAGSSHEGVWPSTYLLP
jgi:hypothetical protein